MKWVLGCFFELGLVYFWTSFGSSVRAVDPINADIYDCSAYEDYEERVQCGKNGYLIKYGKKNCDSFTSPDVLGRFDDRGQAFVKCTKQCLLKILDEIVNEEEDKKQESGVDAIDCAELKVQAFKSHVDCYLECGFCTACKTNKYAFLRAYDLKDFMTPIALKQVFTILQECGPLSCFQLTDYVRGFVGNINVLYN